MADNSPSHEQRVENTMARRLVYKLHEWGVISEVGVNDLIYPRLYEIEAAEEAAR